jgi:hypothetical protein
MGFAALYPSYALEVETFVWLGVATGVCCPCGFRRKGRRISSVGGRSRPKVTGVIHEFPQDHELIAFFEAEPNVLDPGVPWIYNTLDFTTTRDGIEVRCHIVSSYGEITTRLVVAGQELAKFELRDAESIRVVMDKRQEVLVASFAPSQHLDNFALQLRPRVWVAWGNLHQFP